MNVLVIGSGGREHALAWKIAQSPLVRSVYCAPGNPGMEDVAQRVEISVSDTDGLLNFADSEAVDLTVVGPEAPLATGIVDRFARRGLRAFGPLAKVAQIEASKSFAKHFMDRHGIPTARSESFDSSKRALDYVRTQGAPIVVKADGLAAGKGVTVASTVREAEAAVRASMEERAFGNAGDRVVIEECLVGEEASVFAICDGDWFKVLLPSQDHKPVFDEDDGPNTGGMGAYAPAPVVDEPMLEQIAAEIIGPAVAGMRTEGTPYTGVLYAGLMITDEGPKVIEFNCRFGDPETQVVLPLMKSDLVPALMACCSGGSLSRESIEWQEGACVTVVMASAGYPGTYHKGKSITGLDDVAAMEGVTVFHAGTRRDGDHIVTNGGRVLNVTGRGRDIESAIGRTYAAVERIHFDDAHFRRDIGAKAVMRLRA